MARFPKYSPKQLEQFEGSAINELEALDQLGVQIIGSWWMKWYLKVGHRRLGRNLIRALKSAPKSSKRHTKTSKQMIRNDDAIPKDLPRVVGNIEKFVFTAGDLDSKLAFSFSNSYPTVKVILNRNHDLFESLSNQILTELDNSREKRPLISMLAAWWQLERSHEIDSVRQQMQDIRFDLSRAMSTQEVQADAEFY